MYPPDGSMITSGRAPTRFDVSPLQTVVLLGRALTLRPRPQSLPYISRQYHRVPHVAVLRLRAKRASLREAEVRREGGVAKLEF